MKGHTLLKDFFRRFCRNKMAMTGLLILILMITCAIFADTIAPYGYNDQNPQAANQFPSAAHWLGTDDFGRDILSRIIFGARISLKVAFVAVSMAVILGGTIGATAAYYSRISSRILRWHEATYYDCHGPGLQSQSSDC